MSSPRFSFCRRSSVVALLFSVLLASAAMGAAPLLESQRSDRFVASLNAGWRFLQGDPYGVPKPRFDDTAWRVVDVPHDWSIEGAYNQNAPSRRGGGYLPSGVSWYRRTFAVPGNLAGRRVYLEFDGVMAHSRVWVNDYHLGHRPNGYVSFRYDITDQVRFGPEASNVIAVRTDTSVQPASRWYTGQGIHRSVRLVVTDPVHVAPWGVFVTTAEASAQRAVLRVQTTVANAATDARDIALETALVGPDGAVLQTVRAPAQAIAAGGSTEFVQTITVANPQLWSLEATHLHRVVSRVIANGQALDGEVTTFGIRDARFEADTGFWLNGRNFKLLGVCLHHDGGAFGAAVPLSVWERRLTQLKQLGVNAVRTAHNPPTPDFLDLCDRLGFLVMDEVWDAWTYGKNHAEMGIHLDFRQWWEADTRDTVLRDRNHPSVVMWSTGNEIHDTPHPDLAKRILRGLVDTFHRYDPSRPVTQGLFRPNVSRDYDNGLADMLDVVGQNYRENELIAAHAQKPTRKVIGTENQHSRQAWLALRDHAFMSGQFLWAGIEYLGESDWPGTTFAAALLDRTGAVKIAGLERQSWWASDPVVNIVRRTGRDVLAVTDPGYESAQQLQQQRRAPAPLQADWTPANLAAHPEEVEVYSNCEQVELFLNGQSLGVQLRPADASPRAWRVTFAPGVLKAVGTNAGQVVATQELRTAGAPARLAVVSDRTRVSTAFDDVAQLTIHVVDEHGVVVPSATPLITCAISGPGVIVAVDNADRESHESYRGNQRTAHAGRIVAFVRASAAAGTITFTAAAPDLAAATVVLEVAPQK